MGPCASESQFKTVLSYIDKGLEEGATILTGGKRVEKGNQVNGHFVEPTIFDNCTPEMTIVQ